MQRYFPTNSFQHQELSDILYQTFVYTTVMRHSILSDTQNLSDIYQTFVILFKIKVTF